MTLASDGDREATVERLRVAYEEGRLTRTELDERVDGAYRARTHDELVVLEHGLPTPPPAASPPAPVVDEGYPAAQIGAAVLLTLLVPFGDVAALIIALASRGSAATSTRRRQLTWWAVGSAVLIALKVLVVLLVVPV